MPIPKSHWHVSPPAAGTCTLEACGGDYRPKPAFDCDAIEVPPFTTPACVMCQME